MAAKTEKKVVVTDRKAELETQVRALAKQKNECREFNEYEEMAKIDEKIEKAVSDYITEAENDCFNILKKAENPMLEAAKQMTFTVIRVRDVKIREGEDKGKITTVVEFVPRGIDPLRLHNKTPNGIGANEKWMYMVEDLNRLYTEKAADDCGLDYKQVRNTIAMSEAARKLEGVKYDPKRCAKLLADETQKVINAMLGNGYDITKDMIGFLEHAHTKGGRDNLTVVCSTHKGMRGYMLGLCHKAVTGEDFGLVYKQKKQG